jgi:hypothetical protein
LRYQIILLVQGQADVAAIRFSLESLPDLGKFPQESAALLWSVFLKIVTKGGEDGLYGKC